MNAPEFEAFLKTLLEQDASASVSVATFAEAGYAISRYGLRMTLPAGATIYLQIVSSGGTRPAADHLGSPPPPTSPVALPARGRTPLAAVEEYLAAVLTGSRDRRIRDVEVYGARPVRGAVPYGLNVTFHSGARISCYVAHALRAGVNEPGTRRFPSVRAV
ncbi:hypothetical protein ACF09G_31545 [Streptomyces albogriseolus]|uniref:hypothetical protein n=1 Tax=Streptomyces TaxID=1883 RepID=UPI0019BD7F9E|nr:hypothetical protein [Streptomyces sp.]